MVHAAAVKSARVSEGQFLNLCSGDTRDFVIEIAVFSRLELNLQSLSEDRQNQLMVSYCND